MASTKMVPLMAVFSITERHTRVLLYQSDTELLLCPDEFQTMRNPIRLSISLNCALPQKNEIIKSNNRAHKDF